MSKSNFLFQVDKKAEKRSETFTNIFGKKFSEFKFYKNIADPE